MTQGEATYNVGKDAYDADVELLKGYVGVSSEILKLSLVVLGVVGYLFKEESIRTAVASVATYVVTGTTLLLVAGAGSLAHRYLALDGLAEYIGAIRKRTSLSASTRKYKRSARWLAVASASFVCGTGLIAFAVVKVMLR